MRETDDIETIDRLSHQQEAWLVHAVRNRDRDSGFQHVQFRITGEMDLRSFVSAWQHVVDRHPMLRTSFHWEGLSHPVQVEHRRVEVPVRFLDWRDAGAEEGERRLAALLAEDRARGLDLSSAPLMRLTVVHLDDGDHRVVWSLHHLLMDGWSTALVHREAMAAFDALRAGDEPSDDPAPAYREYVAWQRRQSEVEAEARWRPLLRALPEAPIDSALLGPAADASARRVQHWLIVPDGIRRRLESRARAARLTVASAFLGAWSLILSRAEGQPVVATGLAVSGRPPELPGVDRTVGLFLNTLPLVARVEPDDRTAGWLAGLQRQRAAMGPVEHVSLAQLGVWAGMAARRPLFDSVLALENYPSGPGADTDGRSASRVDLLAGEVTSAYPLTVAVLPRERTRILLHHDPGRLPLERLDWLEAAWDAALAALADGMERPVGALLEELPSPPGAGPSRSAAEPSRSAAGELVRPRDDRERRVAAIWCELLGVDRAGAHDNFFDLGGSSLLAGRAIQRMRRDLGVELELQDLVFHTLAQVAATCPEAVAGTDTPSSGIVGSLRRILRAGRGE